MTEFTTSNISNKGLNRRKKKNWDAKRLPLLLVAMLFFLPGYSQFNNSSFKSIQDEYPDYNFIKLSKKVKLSIDIVKDELDIQVERKEKILYLKNNSALKPENSTYTSTFNELLNFEANSYVLDNGRYRKIPVKTFDKVKQMGNYAFYDDVTEMIFTYPGVSEGSIMELNTTHKLLEPRFLGIFFINEHIPVRDFELIIECNKDVNLDFIYKNLADNSFELQESTSRQKKTYILKKTKLERIPFDDYEPNRRYFIPHIIPLLRAYSIKDKEVKLLENTDDLYSWYTTFVEAVDKNIDYAPLQKIIDENVPSDIPEIEKVKIIYSWVQENIKYIAFEDGMGGFVPRKPNEVLKKRYGDCKDKSSLLRALLKQAGINAYFTWIGTRDLPYKYSEISSPVVDNHMIVTYINKDNYYFLDGTGSYQSIDIPTSFIQGKEALIGIEKDKYEIKQVPVIKASDNLITDSIYLKLNKNSLDGKGVFSTTGLAKIRIQYQINTDNKTDQKKSLENILQKGNNKFILKNFKLPEDNRFSKNYTVEYDFSLQNYAQNIDNELFVNLNLNKHWLKYKLDKTKETPFELNNTLTNISTYILEIPNGYSISYIPENTSFNSKNFSYSLIYKLEGNTLIYSHTAIVDKILFEKDEFEEWNKFITSLEKSYKETILIEKK